MSDLLSRLDYEDVHTWEESVRGLSRWYQYGTPLRQVAAGTVAAPIRDGGALIEIDEDSYFFARTLSGVFLDSTGLEVDFTTSPQPLVEFMMTGSGALIINGPTYWENVVGTAAQPYVLDPPLMLNPRDTIQPILSNRAGAIRLWQVVFSGTRLKIR